jgi:hypothetical protein
VPAQREDTIARRAFAKCICKNIDVWFAFAQQLELDVRRIEDIILVTGRDLARSWLNVAFSDCQGGEQISFGAQVTGISDVEWQISPEDIRGAAVNCGPSGQVLFLLFPVPILKQHYQNLPEDQCIFLRGFRVYRLFGIIPRLRGAADPTWSPGRDEPESDKQLMSTPPETNVRQSVSLM